MYGCAGCITMTYTPDGEPAKRRIGRSLCMRRVREAYALHRWLLAASTSLRRIAHYDYWSENCVHSAGCKADLLLYGNAERSLVELYICLREANRGGNALRGSVFQCASVMVGSRLIRPIWMYRDRLTRDQTLTQWAQPSRVMATSECPEPASTSVVVRSNAN